MLLKPEFLMNTNYRMFLRFSWKGELCQENAMPFIMVIFRMVVNFKIGC